MTTENNVAAQAGDEPMPCPFCGSGAHVFGAYNAFAVNCTGCNAYGPSMDRQGAIDGWNKRYVAAGTLTDEGTKVSPRATADVERVATECMEALAIGYVEFDEDLNENVCADCSTPTGSEWGDHTPDCLVVRARAAIATTKPGA